MVDLRLVFVDGPLQGKDFPLTGTVSIGRYRDNVVVVPSPDISRHHSRLIRNGDTLVLQDLSSKNGTFVNGQRISMVVVMPGDKIAFGEIVASIVQFSAESGHDTAIPMRRIVESPAVSLPLASDSDKPSGDLAIWDPPSGLAGLTEIKVVSRLATGVFAEARHPQLGSVHVFIYYPDLCADSPFRRLAGYEAETRFVSSIEGLPRLLEITRESGVMLLVYEKADGAPPVAAQVPSDSAMAGTVFELLESGLRLVEKLIAAGKSHCCIHPRTVFRGNSWSFACFGVLLPERIERTEKAEAAMCDLRDLCACAFFLLTGIVPSEGVLERRALRAAGADSALAGAPPALAAVILRGLCLTGASRYGSVNEFKRDLSDLCSGHEARVLERLSREDAGT